MRDLLGESVQRRREIARAALAAFARYGYEQVITPAFEREDVLLRGAGADGRDLVRFLDPDTAEVLALRSDMTPQVARIVATRPGTPLPCRISYEGSVLRRARGRSSRQRQLSQTGVECVGWASPDADLEVLRVTLEALRDNGIRDVVVELSHAAPLRAALAGVPAHAVDAVADGLARKDRAAWEHPLRALPEVSRALSAVCALSGEATAVCALARDALRDLVDADTLADVASMERAARAVLTEGLATSVLADLGELRGQAYYTGSFFQVFVAGAPSAVAAGGRYDQLLAGFGVDLPATGAGIDLDALASLCGEVELGEVERVVVAGPSETRAALAAQLRRMGAVAIERDEASDDELTRFARAARAKRVIRAQ